MHSSFRRPPTTSGQSHKRKIFSTGRPISSNTGLRIVSNNQMKNVYLFFFITFVVYPPHQHHCLNRDIMSCQMSGRSGCHGWDKQENKRQSGCNVVCVIVQSIEEKQKHFFAFCTFFHFLFFGAFYFFLLWTNKRRKDKVFALGYLQSMTIWVQT